MKALIILIISAVSFLNASTHKPYTLEVKTDKNIKEVVVELNKALADNGLENVGEYLPANDNNRYIICFTNSDLKNKLKSLKGLRSFAAVLRIGITVESSKTLITYTDPMYWGQAYCQSDFKNVRSVYAHIESKLKKATSTIGNFIGEGFGSASGISSDDLKEYHYMFGMPYFEDNIEIKKL